MHTYMHACMSKYNEVPKLNGTFRFGIYARVYVYLAIMCKDS
jgi:hypothetical protein